MKKALIVLLVIIVCILTVILTSGLGTLNFHGFYLPLLLLIINTSICIYYARFPADGEINFHPSDTQLTAEERIIQYHGLSAAFRYFIIPQFFLIFYYSLWVKSLAGVIIFMLGFMLSNFYGVYKNAPLVNARREKEKKELEEQLKRESDKD